MILYITHSAFTVKEGLPIVQVRTISYRPNSLLQYHRIALQYTQRKTVCKLTLLHTAGTLTVIDTRYSKPKKVPPTYTGKRSIIILLHIFIPPISKLFYPKTSIIRHDSQLPIQNHFKRIELAKML